MPVRSCVPRANVDPQNSSFDPGGWLFPPKAVENGTKRLDLRIYPRYSFYLPSDKKGSFIINTPVQDTFGQPYKNSTYDPQTSPNTTIPFSEMKVLVKQEAGNVELVKWTKVPVNGIAEVEFDLSSMTPDAKMAWGVYSTGISPDAIQSYYSISSVTVLPDRSDTGSMARIDRLHGGLEVRSNLTNYVWKPIFPYSFYTSWDWIMDTLTAPNTTHGNLETFRNRGYNLIHPVPPGGCDPYNHTILTQLLTELDRLELYLMYDMRNSYTNLSCISLQLPVLQKHPSLLLYYTADEPDGWSDPLNATSLAYERIQSIDPYHPVSLVLNCANFYFKEYSEGADILLEDVYPIATNTSHSTKWDTVCNATYGDCGCDDCHSLDAAFPAYVQNPFLDIIDRTENLYAYQDWIGSKFKKPVWGVPQNFFDGVDDYWKRFPTANETAVMGILRIMHGAKGVVAWIYPTSDEIEAVTTGLAELFASEQITKFTLGGEAMDVMVSGDEGWLDVVAWVVSGTEGVNGSETVQSEVLLAYVNPRNASIGVTVEIRFPTSGRVDLKGAECLWGPCNIDVQGDGKVLRVHGLEAFEVAVVKI